MVQSPVQQLPLQLRQLRSFGSASGPVATPSSISHAQQPAFDHIWSMSKNICYMHPPLPKLFCEYKGFQITPVFLVANVQRFGGVMLPPCASPGQSTWLARVASCAAPTVWPVQPSTATPDEGDTDVISGEATPARRHGWNDRYGLCLLMYTCFFPWFFDVFWRSTIISCNLKFI